MKIFKQLKQIFQDNKKQYLIALGVVSLGAYLLNAGNTEPVLYGIGLGIFSTTFLMFALGLFLGGNK